MAAKLSLAIIQNRASSSCLNTTILSGVYENNRSKLKCKCKRCARVWISTWLSLQSGRECPSCGHSVAVKQRVLSKSEATRKLQQRQPTVEMVGTFVGTNETVMCKCTKCNTLWRPVFANVYRSGCTKCNAINRMQTKKLELEKKIHGRAELVGEYAGSQHPTLFKCSKCAQIWKTTPETISRAGCPFCSSKIRETLVRKIMQKHTGVCLPPARPTEVPWLRGLTLDGYNEKHKIAFEYQGHQHYQLVNFGGAQDTKARLHKRKLNDARKRIQCWRHGVKLIRIPYWIKNVDEFIKSRLESFGVI